MKFAGYDIIASRIDGDTHLTCHVFVGNTPQRHTGLASQIIEFVESDFKPGYFGDIRMIRVGDDIVIGCLSDTLDNFMKIYHNLNNTV